MATEEVFGPALPISRVNDLDEAIECANSRSSASARRCGRATFIERGKPPSGSRPANTWISSRTKVYNELPFGGWKSSGYGKEHGEEALAYYAETKSVVVNSGP